MTTPKTILIVEDDEILIEALETELEDAGFETVVAHNGKEALDQLEKKEPNIILLDIVMPKIDGFEFLETLKRKKIHQGIPVVVLTNLGQDEDRERAIELGAKDYWIKASHRLETITEKVKAILNEA